MYGHFNLYAELSHKFNGSVLLFLNLRMGNFGRKKTAVSLFYSKIMSSYSSVRLRPPSLFLKWMALYYDLGPN